MLYTINPTKEKSIFRISKLDDDLDPQGMYELYLNRRNQISGCTCIAGTHNRWCRHKQMFVLFKKMGRIGTGWFFDGTNWHEPVKVE